MKHNFKVGYKVRIKPYDEVENHLGISERRWAEHTDREYEVTFVGNGYVDFKESCFSFPVEALESVYDKRELIVYSNGPETVAIEKVNGKTIKKAVAKCSPSDEYKWETGRDLALERLLKEDKPEEKPPYNGKVVCVRNSFGNERVYKVGKIYQFENGFIYGETEVQKPDEPVHDFEEWKKWSSSEWVEIVE